MIGHSIHLEAPQLEELREAFSEPTTNTKKESSTGTNHPQVGTLSFEQAASMFNASMQMYRESVLTTIKLSPAISRMMIVKTLVRFARRRGTKVDELTTQEFDSFKLPLHSLPSILRKNDEAVAALNGAKHLPQMAVIGLISSYDAFLSNIMNIIFSNHSELVLTSDREIKFSELANFSSIEDAKKI